MLEVINHACHSLCRYNEGVNLLICQWNRWWLNLIHLDWKIWIEDEVPV